MKETEDKSQQRRSNKNIAGTDLNWKFICRVSGSMLALESFFLFATSGVSIYYEESPLAFILSGIITLACGLALALPNKMQSKIKVVSKRESCISVTLTWFLFTVFASLPFLLSGEIPLPADAFFEASSGITTTGSSVLTNIDGLSKGMQFWRHLLQWLGGMGIIVFSLAILPLVGGEAAQLFDAESTGLTHDKFRPRVVQMAKRLWGIYLTLTVVLGFLLTLGGMDIFDAVCHAFSTISTGGYSTKQLSIAYWDSVYLETIICVFMVIGAINFSLYYFLLKGQFKKFFKDEELRWFLGIILICTLVVTFGLFYQNNRLTDSFRLAVFQVISVFTTTGFATGDFYNWGPFYCILFLLMMIVCGCAGSTSGGLKTVRAVVLVKNTFGEFARLLNPRAIIPVRLNGQALSFGVVQRLMAFVFLYIFIIFFSWGVLILSGMSFTEAMGAAVTAIGNVGPGFGENSFSGSFIGIPDFAKWYMSMLMIVGRLEIFTALVLFTPNFWKE
ncbi:MAG: TrkH family potassium uptake protein [Dysgonamonadaceae bacterium]|jgi:trk system potassium uptake protein TrkH|nr:TrkH family potassium uptake protein [Dysgonamonadaceae bacterium]